MEERRKEIHSNALDYCIWYRDVYQVSFWFFHFIFIVRICEYISFHISDKISTILSYSRGLLLQTRNKSNNKKTTPALRCTFHVRCMFVVFVICTLQFVTSCVFHFVDFVIWYSYLHGRMWFHLFYRRL